MKVLLKAVTPALKLIFPQPKCYNFKYYVIIIPITYYLASSEQSIWHNKFHTINKLNSRNKAIWISKIDFSALYWYIPHHKMKAVMGELIKFCFNNSAVKKLYRITTNRGVWTIRNINVLLIKHLWN